MEKTLSLRTAVRVTTSTADGGDRSEGMDVPCEGRDRYWERRWLPVSVSREALCPSFEPACPGSCPFTTGDLACGEMCGW